jgi:hypothetical protein
MNKVIGLILFVVAGYFAINWYGDYRYGQGVDQERLDGAKAKKEYEDAANSKIAKAEGDSAYQRSETARHVKLAAVRDSDIRDRNARIIGLLNTINHAKPKPTIEGANDAEAEWIALFGACRTRAESLSVRLGELGGEAAELADQVNGLQGYIKAMVP